MRVRLDIIQKQFTANRRGYEPDEVQLLGRNCETMEDLLKENQRLREQMAFWLNHRVAQ